MLFARPAADHLLTELADMNLLSNTDESAVFDLVRVRCLTRRTTGVSCTACGKVWLMRLVLQLCENDETLVREYRQYEGGHKDKQRLWAPPP